MVLCLFAALVMRKEGKSVVVHGGRLRKGGRISRIGSYAISSSVCDDLHHPCITCTTFNILAPIYKRLNHAVGFFFFRVSFVETGADCDCDFYFCVFGLECMNGSGSELSRERLQGVLDEEEPDDIGLVVGREIVYHLSAGFCNFFFFLFPMVLRSGFGI